MKKSILCGLLAAALLALPARAARTVPVQVDGERLAGTAHLESGVTYVPLRYLLDRLGGWEEAHPGTACCKRAEPFSSSSVGCWNLRCSAAPTADGLWEENGSLGTPALTAARSWTDSADIYFLIGRKLWAFLTN